jgi:hypothetical protein|tara:strand:- start:473 stop:691 length:219 start_codon:yes stop_codon:yes gene_type:complete
MAQFKVITALKAQAEADKAKALMALELLTENAAGVGDHTVKDFIKDADEALQLLGNAEDRLEVLEKYFGKYE